MCARREGDVKAPAVDRHTKEMMIRGSLKTPMEHVDMLVEPHLPSYILAKESAPFCAMEAFLAPVHGTMWRWYDDSASGSGNGSSTFSSAAGTPERRGEPACVDIVQGRPLSM